MAELEKPRDSPGTGAEAEAGILPSHGISLNLPDVAPTSRPPAVKHLYAAPKRLVAARVLVLRFSCHIDRFQHTRALQDTIVELRRERSMSKSVDRVNHQTIHT